MSKIKGADLINIKRITLHVCTVYMKQYLHVWIDRYFFSFKHREICQEKAWKNVNGSALHAIPCRCGSNERNYVQYAHTICWTCCRVKRKIFAKIHFNFFPNCLEKHLQKRRLGATKYEIVDFFKNIHTLERKLWNGRKI